MGQKVDPRGLRLGITRAWDSNWYADKKEYVKYFHEDVQIKEFIKKNYFHTGISKVRIERTSPSQVVVHIHTGKAGLIIGRKGAEIDALRAKLEKLTGKKSKLLKVQEIKDLNWRCCISCRIDSCSNRKENSLQKSYDSSYIKIYEISRS